MSGFKSASQSSQNMLTTLLTPVRGVVLIDSALQRWLITRPEAALAAITDKLSWVLSTKKSSPEPLLAKEHWKLASEVSQPSFFENNYGFSKEELVAKPYKVPTTKVPPIFFLARNVNSPQLQFARGFVTRRASTPTPLGQSKPAASATGPDLPKEMADFIKAYEAGKAAGAGSGSDCSTSTSSSQGASQPFMATVTGSKDSGAGSNTVASRFWKMWKTGWGVLGVVAALIVVLNMATGKFKMISFNVVRGQNEIAPEDIDVDFDDVMGCEDAKSELRDIVDFLTYPEKYSALGGRLPKGVLLTGPPGTGKTLLARAVAGEAGVPFFHASGSEFDEVLVGQGARRVRDLFKTAKARAPCVIFIDEIDTVGGKRTTSTLHPYANQTINQLLSEMDGFVSNEGVIVLGATNRSDQLDKALLRPGRFDTSVEVPVPDMAGRLAILGLYLGKIKHDMSIDVDTLAKLTIGMTGAELENMVNMAAVKAAAEAKEWVSMQDLYDAHDKITLGTDKKSKVKDKDDLKVTAYHEAGHTLVAVHTKEATPLHKVTIIARGQTGGHTAFLPKNDQQMQTKAQCLARLDVGMGGRAAEELIFGKDQVTTGASSDLNGATRIAEAMVTSLGMSEKVGLRVLNRNEGESLVPPQYSPAQEELIDSEVNVLLNSSYARAMTILRTHRGELEALANALLKYETLDAEDVKSIIEGNPKRLAAKAAKARQQANHARQQHPSQPTAPQLPGLGGAPA